jgi:RNA polymerase sigma-70 factor (ECF subfamily)
MFHVAFGLLHNRADAEEMAQDTFIRAHRSLANFRGDSSLAAWLYCIALNLSRNRYWYFFRRGRHVSLPLDATLGADGSATFAEIVASDAPSPIREVVNLEFSAIVSRCMGQLPPRQREILQLLNVEQQTYAGIARLLRIRIGTVKSRVARARAGLRVLLGETYPEFRSKVAPFSCFESLRCPSPGRGELVCA